MFACVLEDGEALTVQVLLRDRDPQIGNGFHGLTMGCVTVHASELFGQNERLFLTELCRSPIPTPRQRSLRHGFRSAGPTALSMRFVIYSLSILLGVVYYLDE